MTEKPPKAVDPRAADLEASTMNPLERLRLERYVARTHQGLERALIRAEKRRDAQGTTDFDLRADRWVVFSDQHRGARNRADDFRRSERAYNAALAYYLEQGHTLLMLGDVEELWQESPKRVMQSYPRTYELESAFHRDGRYFRIWGNHDDLWESASAVRAHLAPVYGPPDLEVHESLLVRVVDRGRELGQLFFIHGHQGTANNDRWGGLTRIPVRWVWRPLQRLTGLSLNTPAKSLRLRRGLNWALYQWAESHDRMVLVAGHTHHPIFEPHLHVSKLRRRLGREREALTGKWVDPDLRDRLAEAAADLEWVAAQELELPFEQEGGRLAEPCYFNTGCCCYRDGDITAMEIAGGEIRLVRWPDRSHRPRPLELASASLADVFSKLARD